MFCLKYGRTCIDNSHGALDCNDFHLQPFSRFPSLLDLARISLPVKHTFSCTKVRRNSCLVGVDVSCSGFMEAGSRRSLRLRPMANSMGVLQLKVTCVFLTVAALRINWAGVICARVVWSRFFEAVSTSAKRKFLEQSYTRLSSVRPWCMWSCRKYLHVAHSVECQHVVTMVESHICTSRLWVHLEGVHPLAKLSNNFRWEVLVHGQAVKCDVAPSKTIRNPKVLSPIFADPWSRKMRSPNSSARSPL